MNLPGDHSTRQRRSFRASAPDRVCCRLCGRAFRAVTYTHLVYVHRFDPAHPIEEYKLRFGVRRTESPDTLRKRIREMRGYYERVGRRWTKRRIRRMILDLVRHGEPITSRIVQMRHGTLHTMACTLYGSWERAVEACGIRYDQVRLFRLWTREKIIRAIRERRRTGKDINAYGMEEQDPGLLDTAIRHFGSWDAALRAAGIDSARVRRKRKWNRKKVITAIRRLGPNVLSSQVRKLDSGLLYMGTKYFGGWRAAVRAAGRTYPPLASRE